MRVSSSRCWRRLSHDVPRRSPAGLTTAHEARFASSSRRPAVRWTGSTATWISEYVRRLADTTLRSYAHELLHFLRWWESVHHTDAVTERCAHRIDLARLCAIPVQPATASLPAPPSTAAWPSSIVPCASPFPTLPARSLPAFSQRYWQRAPMGIGTAAPGLEPLAREDAQTHHRAACRWTRWRDSGPASAPRGTWPSWA